RGNDPPSVDTPAAATHQNAPVELLLASPGQELQQQSQLGNRTVQRLITLERAKEDRPAGSGVPVQRKYNDLPDVIPPPPLDQKIARTITGNVTAYNNTAAWANLDSEQAKK